MKIFTQKFKIFRSSMETAGTKWDSNRGRDKLFTLPAIKRVYCIVFEPI